MIRLLFFIFFFYKLLKYVFFRKTFNHKCILITGGAGALGVELGRLFSNIPGTKVILMDINKPRLEKAREVLPNVITVCCDITNYKETQKAILSLLELYDIDTLVNNAGIVSKKSLLQLTEKDINLTFAVNSIAPMYLTKLLLPHMIKKKKGHIVNISSVAGIVGTNKLTDYCASKFALVGFHDALRVELKNFEGLHSTCICPYFFRSDLFKDSKGYPWPLNYIMYIYSLKEITNLIFRDIVSVKEKTIYPKIFGWLIRIKYIFPKYVQDNFISLGSNVD